MSQGKNLLRKTKTQKINIVQRSKVVLLDLAYRFKSLQVTARIITRCLKGGRKINGKQPGGIHNLLFGGYEMHN